MTRRKPASTQSALARELGYSRQRISQLVREAWWPARGEDGWDVDRCRRALEQHVGDGRRPASARRPRRRKSGPSTTAPAAPAVTDPEPTALPAPGDRDAAIAALRRCETEEETCRAALVLVAAELAGAAEGGVGALPPKLITSLESASRELGRVRQRHQALAQRAGELIERSAAVEAAAEIARRLVAALDEIEVLLPTELVALGLDLDQEQQRAVQAWFRGRGRALREALAADLVAEASG